MMLASHLGYPGRCFKVVTVHGYQYHILPCALVVSIPWVFGGIGAASRNGI